MREDAAHAFKKIKLDVGGKIFCISKTHLLRVECSYFHATLAFGHWKPGSDGAYFSTVCCPEAKCGFDDLNWEMRSQFLF